jgi:hypothetical protein
MAAKLTMSRGINWHLGRWLKDHLPQSFIGAIEYHLRPELLDCWGGPFNGQCFRQLIFLDLLEACCFDAFVETGTYRGSTTLFLSQNSGGAPVYSSEVKQKFFEIARRRLRALPKVNLWNLDSRAFLSAIALNRKTKTFFYFDAHWLDDLPLADEAEFVIRNFNTFVIMIDDFQVTDDPGYAFDDYGPGKRLSLRDFPFHSDTRVCSYFPARHSSRESGNRRGCIVLASRDLQETVESLDCIRPAAVGG